MSFSRRPLLGRRFCLFLLFIFPLHSADAQKAAAKTGEQRKGGFHWVTQRSDAQLWKQIQDSFREELMPDKPGAGIDETDVYVQKTIERAGVLNHSVLVILRSRQSQEVFAQNTWDEYSTAYNYDVISKKKSTIPNAEFMWMWKFAKVAKFGPSSIPDAVFTYFDCTECESAKQLASLQYEARQEKWEVRSWGDGKDVWWAGSDGLVLYEELIGESDTISFDCAYGILDLNGKGFDDVAVRCKEVKVSDDDLERGKIEDTTLLYGLSDGEFKRRNVADQFEVVQLMAKMCKMDSSSLLCKLPGYMTVTSE